MLQLNEKVAAKAIASEKSQYGLIAEGIRTAPDRQKLKQILVQECLTIPKIKGPSLLELLLKQQNKPIESILPHVTQVES